jgi:hypothetical protein
VRQPRRIADRSLRGTDRRRRGYERMAAFAQKSVTSPGPVPHSQHCRARARECRMLAGQLRLDSARRQMLSAAEDFERIAYEAREREIVHGMSQLGALMRGLHR